MTRLINMKQDGGLIRNWQLHHLTLPDMGNNILNVLYKDPKK